MYHILSDIESRGFYVFIIPHTLQIVNVSHTKTAAHTTYDARHSLYMFLRGIVENAMFFE